MIDPHASLASIEAYDGLSFDADVVARLWETGRQWTGKPFRAALPSFVSYDSDEIDNCSGGGAFPAFSITGGVCALGCAHCRGRILEPMIPARTADALENAVLAMMSRQPVRGFLLSGGSNARNEVKYEPYLPVVRRLKERFPALKVAVHTGLVDRRRAQLLAEAGVDVAMLDIIGSEETIREVYNLRRPVNDFESSLAELVGASLAVVPHVVIGLHFGRLLGEVRALDIIARQRTAAAILVVVMPHLATSGRFAVPDGREVGEVFATARDMLADRRLMLGCARPPGLYRRMIDAYAVLAGLDGIAHPSPGAVTLARALGRVVGGTGACCGVDACAKAA